jgi:RING finger protein 121/175
MGRSMTGVSLLVVLAAAAGALAQHPGSGPGSPNTGEVSSAQQGDDAAAGAQTAAGHGRADHQAQHKKYALAHGGHETRHSILLLVMLVILVGGQFALVWWKKNYYKSFFHATLLGMWTIPVVFCAYWQFWRMLTVWSLFSAATGRILYQAWQPKNINSTTPQVVYAFFFWVHRVCYTMALSGYTLVVLDFLGVTHILVPIFGADHAAVHSLSYYGAMVMFYGLYFGVLGRDFAELATDRIAAKMGFGGGSDRISESTMRPNTCYICNEVFGERKTATLEQCGHSFHDWCIRGWTIVGKKDMCPFCSEKVELSKVFTNPWDKPNILWVNLMDTLRYMIVWNPVILITIQAVLYFLDRPNAGV